MDFLSSPSPSTPTPIPFHDDDLMQGDMSLWDFPAEPFNLGELNPDLPVVPSSAFTPYVVGSQLGTSSYFPSSSSWCNNERNNIHHRVIELLRNIPRSGQVVADDSSMAGEYSRSFRHMMRERQRREKLSQSYADLHSMLPYRSKADKNSIVLSATAYVKELKGMKEELARRNEELIIKMMAATKKYSNSSSAANLGGQSIKFGVANPTTSSSLDSMICALRCLKAMEVKVRAIQTDFSGQELTTVMSIETNKMGPSQSEVERAVECALVSHFI